VVSLSAHIQEVVSLKPGWDTLLIKIFVVFISPSKQMLGQNINQAKTASLQILPMMLA
jgi:hypothetical protein